MDIERRRTLTVLGSGIAAGLMGPALLRCTSNPAADSSELGNQVPLPYAALDPTHVGELAYRNFYHGDCMYGVFASLVEALAEKVGEPFASYPTSVTRYGAGGVMGWGTLCGAANGAAMAIYLVSKSPAQAISEVFGFYEQEALPNFVPAEPKFQVASSVAGSTLCHVSISKWCDASGFKSYSAERADRCAQLVASVAMHTAEVLNSQADGTFNAVHKLSGATIACRGCHDAGGVLENSRGMMDCEGCHFTQVGSHP